MESRPAGSSRRTRADARRDFDRAEEERGGEIRLGLYLAFLAGTSAIHLTDETYGGASRRIW